MKKIFAILFLVLYTSNSFALTVNIYYYGGKYPGLSLVNYRIAIHLSCGTHTFSSTGRYSDKIICAKAGKHKTLQQYWVSPNFSDFTVP